MSRKANIIRLAVAAAALGLAARGAAAQTLPIPGEDRMAVPQPVGIDGGTMDFIEEARSNYLTGGLTFVAAYDDNILPQAGSSPSDVTYSIHPTFGFDQTRSRFHWKLDYSPGFTFYQHHSDLNQSDHDFSVDLSYRLSQHVTMTLRDTFAKLSTVSGYYGANFNNVGSVLQTPNFSIVPPVTDYLSNTAGGQLTYQFARNSMVGFTGDSTELRFLDRVQLGGGLFDSSMRGGSAFYSYRVSKKHYVGMTYQFQDILALPDQSETQAHTILGYYTFYASQHLSIAFFGGPQRAETSGIAVLSRTSWLPSGGVTLNWQGMRNSFSAEFSHRITDGGGLQGATQATLGNFSVRRQLARFVTSGLSAGYADNKVLNAVAGPNFTNNGHTVSGTGSLGFILSPRLDLELSYTRLHQSYAIPALMLFPDRNRAAVTISYHFDRPLGR